MLPANTLMCCMKEGQTALLLACERGAADVVTVLLTAAGQQTQKALLDTDLVSVAVHSEESTSSYLSCGRSLT